ncbi:MAG: orc1/cdc6 family replication initiation protein [Candidatus Heimdallarchaeota archaeon]|nr:orc1/cdc6 family replication initiation protein [Candidatus Heimdallarchaeota archaeon]
MSEKKVDLDDIFNRFHAPETPIFKDRDSLLSTHVPDHLPHRDEEIAGLANVLGPIMRDQTPSNAFLYGKPGAGKTVVVKYVITYLKGKATEVGVNYDYAFLNCQHVDTEYRLWATLCSKIGEDVPTTGLPTKDVFDVFVSTLEKQAINLTIVLDEIDLLVKKAPDSLYTLTRINGDLKNSAISLIGITNTISFKESIDARIRSTLTEQELIFSPYTANQLQDILKERVKEGFEHGVVDQSAINLSAALAASEHGDARRALDLLRVAGEIAERNQDAKITNLHVNDAQSVIERDTVAEVLIGLPIHSKTVLLAVIKLDYYRKAQKNPDKDEYMISTGKIYEAYLALCDALGMKPVTQRRVGDLINELDLLGMIRANVISKGRYGRTRIIELAVQRAEIVKTLKKEPRMLEMVNDIQISAN